MSKLGLVVIAATFVAVAVPGLAFAQDYTPPPRRGGTPPPPPPPGPQLGPDGYWPRLGLFGGLGAGIGSMTSRVDGGGSESQPAIGGHFNVGYRITPRLGVLLDFWVMGSQDSEFDNVTYLHSIASIGGQIHVTPKLWVRGALGGSRFAANVDGETVAETTESAPAFMIGAGFEVLHSPSFSFDVELRAGVGFYEDGTESNVAVVGSVNWHQLLPVLGYQ